MPALTNRLALSTVLAVLAIAGPTRAQSLNWDPTFTVTATGGGTGPWDTTTGNWFNGTATDVAWPGAGSVAIFGGPTGIVTIAAGGISADGLTFNTDAYTITGGVLTLTGTTPTVSVGAGTTATISSVVAGSGGLTLTGGGTLALTGTNTYTGTTTVLSGTVQVNGAGTLGAGTLQLGDTAGTLTSAANAVFNTGGTIAGLKVTTQTTADTVTIPTGQTLTINGPTTVGVASIAAGNNTVSSLTITGGGALNITAGAATFDVGVTSTSNTFGTQTATLNLAGLNSFTFSGTGNFRVGFGQKTAGTLTLANTGSSTNSITAGTFSVGNSNNGNNAGISTLNLGGGTNTIDANTISIGQGKSAGVLQFVAGVPAAASLTIAGAAGGTSTANISVGVASSATYGGSTARLSLAGHPVTVQAGTVTVGQLSGATGGTSATNETGQATFDTGTFSAATLNIDSETGTATGAPPNGMKSSFTLGTTATDSGVLTINTAINLGNVTSTTVTTAHPSRATFTINGGTATVNTDINSVNSNTAVVTLTSILTLAGGTLDMTGHQIGHATGNNRNISTINLPAAGQTATLANLGGTGINDAGLNMTGAGRLVLAGTNTYTAPTTVTSGTLALAATATVASPVIAVGAAPASTAVLDVSAVTGGFQVASGQTLGGHGTVFGNSTIANGATLAPGSSIPGTLTVSTGTHTWSPGGTYNFVYDPSATPPGPVQGGNNDLLQAASGTNTILNLSGLGAGPGQKFNLDLIPGTGTPVGGSVTYTIADFSPSTATSPITAPSGISGTNLTPYFNVIGTFQGTPTVSLANGNQVQVTFTPTPVPEPAFVLLACGAVAAGLGRRWRRPG